MASKKKTTAVPAYSRVKLTPGDSVRNMRELQEMSQLDLAKVTGLSQPTISGIESGRLVLGVKRAERLARALKVHPAVLLWPHWGEEPAKRAG